MTQAAAKELIKKISEDSDYFYIGFRFEDLDRQVGDVCGNSKHNLGREDERDFPVYGTEEYDDMPELNGTCAYDVSWLNWNFSRPEKECESSFYANHCYVIGSDSCGSNDDPDEGEIVLRAPEVLAKIF